MKPSALQLYAVAVCVAAMLALLIAGAGAAWNGLRMAVPAFTLAPAEHERYQSDNAYAQWLARERAEAPLPTGPALAQRRKHDYSLALRAEWRAAAQQLVRHAILLAIALALFALHWRLLRRQGEGAAPAAEKNSAHPAALRTPPSAV